MPTQPHLRILPSRSEWTALLGLLVMVLAIVWPTRWALAEHRRVVMARYDIAAIVEAIHRFFDEYHTWPSARMGAYGDVRYGEGVRNRELFDVLRATEAAVGPAGPLNPHFIEFLDVRSMGEGLSGVNSSGEFLDPWRQPYQVVLDTDLDNSAYVANSIYGKQLGKSYLVWSCGPDGLSDTADDLRSWE